MSQNQNLKIESLEAQLQKCHQTIAMKDSVIKMLKENCKPKPQRKRVKSVIPYHQRCQGLRHDGSRCTRKASVKKNDYIFCGTHIKGTPHGATSNLTSRGGMRRKKKRTVKKARKKRNRKRRKTSKKSHTRRLKGGDYYYDNNGEPNPESNWDPECPVPQRPTLDYDCDHYMASDAYAGMIDRQIAEAIARVPNPQNGGKNRKLKK